ncbi:MAG: 2-oxoacid:ferredoxin oxidoreductase subunit beta [Candidatus Methanofastidiosia archaeon]
MDADFYSTELEPIWCPGCGDFAVLYAIKKIFSKLEIEPEEVLIASGIGCSSRLPGFVKCYGIHSVHGRVLPIAQGAKLANPDLLVLAVGGDGDGLNIGGGHFPHAARRNLDITYIMMDNLLYGMTKAQPSATTELGRVSKASPFGVIEEPLNPIVLALSYNVSFVARGFSGDPRGLTELISDAIEHKGFSFLDVLSPCTTFFNTYKVIERKAYPIKDHDVTDKVKAFQLSLDKKGIPIGIFYKVRRPTYGERLESSGAFERKMSLEELFSRFG